MNKLLLTGAALLALGTTSAHADEYARTDFSPYLGVYGGYGWTDGDGQGALSGADIYLDGAEYGLFAGMRVDTLLDQTVNRIGLGLTGAVEVNYGWSDQDDTIAGVIIEKNHEYGISFRPGLALIDRINPLDFTTYGILGYKRAEFEVDGLGEDDYDGFELGIGSELVAYDNVGVRLDYSHTWYEEKNSIDPSEDAVKLGLSFQF